MAVVGSTASGKTELSLGLAERLGGEILNTDAMQVYRGMDIGTAKLPSDRRRGIVHHLLDRLDVRESAAVAEFAVLARTVVEDCRARGVAPVLVGGSALYVRAVLDGFEFPGTDPELRSRLEAELAREGAAALHERLVRIDPEAGARVLPGNGRRVVRALEVVELTGRPFAASLPEPAYVHPVTVQIGLRVPRDVLDRRIEQRVAAMWDDGLVEEVRRLDAAGLREGRTASRALGYRQVLAFLGGEVSEADAFEQTVRGTRRFARRQESWFHRDPRVVWLDHDDPDLLEHALAAVPGSSVP